MLRGNWEQSHNIAQDIHTPMGSWIHALIHVIEGDLFSLRSEPAPPVAPDASVGARMSAEGRVKLASTLYGLEEIKARLDGLLKP